MCVSVCVGASGEEVTVSFTWGWRRPRGGNQCRQAGRLTQAPLSGCTPSCGLLLQKEGEGHLRPTPSALRCVRAPSPFQANRNPALLSYAVGKTQYNFYSIDSSSLINETLDSELLNAH